jgi:hypothetical protein
VCPKGDGEHTRKKTDLKPFPPGSPALLCPEGRFHGGHSAGMQNMATPTTAHCGRIWWHLLGWRWLAICRGHPTAYQILWDGTVEEPPLATPDSCDWSNRSFRGWQLKSTIALRRQRSHVRIVSGTPATSIRSLDNQASFITDVSGQPVSWCVHRPSGLVRSPAKRRPP